VKINTDPLMAADQKPSRPSASARHPTRSATERWGGRQILFKEGFLSVPNRFLKRYASLNPPLTPGEALFVLQLMTFKWERAAPFPSYRRIAKAMGVTDKMARRYAQRLQKKGYLVRQFQRRAPNKFDLTGLFEALAGTPNGRSAEGLQSENV
jgi:Helix-turn-helix domain